MENQPDLDPIEKGKFIYPSMKVPFSHYQFAALIVNCRLHHDLFPNKRREKQPRSQTNLVTNDDFL